MSENIPKRAPIAQELAPSIQQTPLEPPATQEEPTKPIKVEIPPEEEKKEMTDEEWLKTLAAAKELDAQEAATMPSPPPQEPVENPPATEAAPATPATPPEEPKTAPAGNPPTPSKNPRQNYKVVENASPDRPVSYLNINLEGDRQKLNEYVDQLDEEYRQNPDADTTYAERLSNSIQIGLRGEFNDQQAEFARSFNKAVEDGHIFVEPTGHVRVAKVSSSLKTPQGGQRILRGQEALMAVRARQLGIFKVTLYNSGFWISLTPLTLSDMARFIKEVDANRQHYGRIVGGLSFLYADLYMKQLFIDLIADHLVDSNVEGLGPNTARDLLPRLVSFHDLDVLAFYACIMTNPKGLEYDVICTNPECRHTDQVLIDLNAGMQIDSSVLGAEAMAFLEAGHAGTRRKQADLVKYRQEILLCPVDVVYKSKNDVFRLKVPTVEEYLRCGNRFLTNLSRICDDGDLIYKANDNGRRLPTSFMQMLFLNIYKTYVPWIKEIDMLMPDGTPSGNSTDDPIAIEETMNIDYGENSNIASIVTAYQNTTRAVYFGVHGLYCQVCGKRADFSKNDYMPLEPLSLFFALSFQRISEMETNS